MSKSTIKATAVITGYDKSGELVYSDQISLDNYYDGEHVWDFPDDIIKIGMVKMQGKIYNYDGNVEQEFETTFSEELGEYLGSEVRLDDGTINKDGIYEKND
jgi:hypothetical protein